MTESRIDKVKDSPAENPAEQEFYRIRFRDDGQLSTASSTIGRLERDEVVMVQVDHGLEPATIAGPAPQCGCPNRERKASYKIGRRPNADELERYENLAPHEASAFAACLTLIEKHKLKMRLVRVERFFNGSKIIFYFTADSRVDFRALVKDLVQEFRTRVEMRQVGVRHETKMLGGMGTCGRELCCSSFIKKFDSVSIKMAKEQDLPLNPSKISGLCNRLLCCLTYEYDTYRRQRKGMPKPGRKIRIGSEIYKVKRQNPLQESLVVQNRDGEDVILQRSEWRSFEHVKTDRGPKKESKRESRREGKKKE
jgi:cell fate regulator YaaT (PSP1 superfamily)